MKLAFTISSLGCGGAEKTVSVMGNYWANKGHDVTILTYDDGSTAPFFSLHPEIRIRPMNVSASSYGIASAVRNNVRKIARLRKHIVDTDPDCVIAFMDANNVATLLATRRLKIPVVVSERVDPAMNPIPAVWRYLRRLTYPLATRVVFQTISVRDLFPELSPTRTAVIPNPVMGVGYPPSYSGASVKPRKSLVTVARLTRQKRLDLLLSAFSLIPNTDECSLTIVGDGPLKGTLENLARELGISHRVSFTGLVTNPSSFLHGADLFVLTSEFEGFPNALLEAMACGVPVISFDCPSGPSEIIRDGIDGILVPPLDIDALARTISKLLDDEPKRIRLGQAGLEVRERFSLSRIMSMWEKILEEIGQENGRSSNLRTKRQGLRDNETEVKTAI
jgi:GalNAc-alpha-(1->4)-GalNAc-alpha-(1->3)-diNAcBac-PP-undecaprenol alpha-1,4-N-acetyl-D-galactosaminyltransferase